jgi:hypothetical protein
MYSPLSKCSGPLRSAGLRDDDYFYAVIVCRAHYGRLRQMPEGDLDELEHVLLDAYKSSRNRAMVG